MESVLRKRIRNGKTFYIDLNSSANILETIRKEIGFKQFKFRELRLALKKNRLDYSCQKLRNRMVYLIDTNYLRIDRSAGLKKFLYSFGKRALTYLEKYGYFTNPDGRLMQNVLKAKSL